jgi:phosphoribosyl-ATP pyrophosphohydrolase/phosphoribosyl-AMP cyclohydrolase
MSGELNFKKMNGLIPAVIQNARSGAVLMVGFMNREALDLTERTKEVHFWSRTKNRIWKKGETSGNVLDLVSIHLDCDNDTMLILAHPRGPVCHTGSATCFEGVPAEGLSELQYLSETIVDRKKTMPAGSYTAKLFSGGVLGIAQKVGEEAVELALASQHDNKTRVIEETADLLYHTLVLLAEKGIPLSDVFRELEKRSQKKS